MNGRDRASRGEPRTGAGQPQVADNPFYVLELSPQCSRAEVERAGQRLLGMLELDLAGARRYPTPLGSRTRDPAKVREAMAELRDPQRRLFHELWVQVPPWSSPSDAAAEGSEQGFGAALSTLGWES